MKTMKYITGLLLAGTTLITIGCGDTETVTPSAVTNLRAETTPGRIVLRWDTPKDGNIEYIKVNYHDPLSKKDVLKTASVFADSVEIPDTRQKYGEYAFTVVSVSETGGLSEVQTISQTSAPAPLTIVYPPIPVTLTDKDLSTNAQEPTEGPIKDLLDDKTGTFFHTAWSVGIPGPHWLQVNLNTTVDGFYRFYYAPRKNANNKPTNFDLMGSTDGETWFLLKNFTKDADKLPVTATDAYTSPVLHADKPFSQIRIVVNATNNNTVFFTMSEFKFWTFEVVDPEAPDVE